MSHIDSAGLNALVARLLASRSVPGPAPRILSYRRVAACDRGAPSRFTRFKLDENAEAAILAYMREESEKDACGGHITNALRAGSLLGKILSLPFVLSLTACPNTEAYWSTPISIKEGLALVEHDLAQANPVVLSEVPPVSKSAQPERDWAYSISTAIFTAQCLNHANNPPVPVLTGAISVALTGQFTTTPSAQIGWATGPSGQLGFQVSISQSQGLTIPIQFISARALPNFYLQQNLAMLQYADDKTKATLVPEIVSTRKTLDDVVTSAIRAYPNNSANCPATLDQVLAVPPIVPAAPPPPGPGGPGRQSNPQGPRS